MVASIPFSLVDITGIYGVPRGGTILAQELSHRLEIPLVEEVSEYPYETLVADDVVDSGRTRNKFGGHPFVSLHLKKVCDSDLHPTYSVHTEVEEWIRYWWEAEEDAEGLVIRMLQRIGEDPLREGLRETPARVIRSWAELYSGYDQKELSSIFKTFDNPEHTNTYNQVVLLKDVEMFSQCEHHMLPFIGKAHIAYIPNEKVIGVSKMARLLEVYSRRLQIQERIGEQVTSDLMEHLECQGAACIIEAMHLCMRMRGVAKQHSTMVTSSLKGIFLTDQAARSELLRLIGI